jgi:methionyl aminopeptidase
MIPIKTRAELERMRQSNRIAARVLNAVSAAVRPGMTTGELDELAAGRMRAMGVRSAFRGYRGYPANICVSVNEEVVHGIPGPRRVEVGDLVGIDVGVVADGFVGDTARTVMVGAADPDLVRLVAVTERALTAAIERAVDGAFLSDVSHAVECVAVEAGFSVVREFCGHGVGSTLHEEPQIANYGPPGKGPRLRAGMTLAIEPMINAGSHAVRVLDDGWTVVTRDGRPSAHAEHTVAVGLDGAEILSKADG